MAPVFCAYHVTKMTYECPPNWSYLNKNMVTSGYDGSLAGQQVVYFTTTVTEWENDLPNKSVYASPSGNSWRVRVPLSRYDDYDIRLSHIAPNQIHLILTHPEDPHVPLLTNPRLLEGNTVVTLLAQATLSQFSIDSSQCLPVSPLSAFVTPAKSELPTGTPVQLFGGTYIQLISSACTSMMNAAYHDFDAGTEVCLVEDTLVYTDLEMEYTRIGTGSIIRLNETAKLRVTCAAASIVQLTSVISGTLISTCQPLLEGHPSLFLTSSNQQMKLAKDVVAVLEPETYIQLYKDTDVEVPAQTPVILTPNGYQLFQDTEIVLSTKTNYTLFPVLPKSNPYLFQNNIDHVFPNGGTINLRQWHSNIYGSKTSAYFVNFAVLHDVPLRCGDEHWDTVTKI